jgi:hypothetical protein
MDSSDDHFARRGACGTKPAIEVEALNFTNPKARQVQADFTGDRTAATAGCGWRGKTLLPGLFSSALRMPTIARILRVQLYSLASPAPTSETELQFPILFVWNQNDLRWKSIG